MIYGVYSIRDVKSGFRDLITEQSDEIAMRVFSHVVKSSDGLMVSFPQDFSIYRLADFDSDSGVLTPLSPIVHLLDAASVR